MFPEPQLSTRDVSLMVTAYSIRYHSTYEARDSLFDMCKIFAGEKFHNYKATKHVMNELYDLPEEMINLCLLCTKYCEPLLPPVSKKKFKKFFLKFICGLEYDLTTESPNYVIPKDLKYQIQVLLQDEEIKKELLKGIRVVKERANGDSRKILLFVIVEKVPSGQYNVPLTHYLLQFDLSIHF